MKRKLPHTRSCFVCGLNNHAGLKLDFEALYLFGLILLDQLTMFLSRLDGSPQNSFLDLVAALERGAVLPVRSAIWAKLRDEMRWLAFAFRVYRNTFIVHAKRPWQRGTIISRNAFSLFTPAPVGWISSSEQRDHSVAIALIAAKLIPTVSPNVLGDTKPLDLLRRVTNDIGRLELEDDRRIVETAMRCLGTETPSFHDVADRLLRFVIYGVPIAIDTALRSPAGVLLEPPTVAPDSDTQH